jgi:hypothetical protein
VYLIVGQMVVVYLVVVVYPVVGLVVDTDCLHFLLVSCCFNFGSHQNADNSKSCGNKNFVIFYYDKAKKKCVRGSSLVDLSIYLYFCISVYLSF